MQTLRSPVLLFVTTLNVVDAFNTIHFKGQNLPFRRHDRFIGNKVRSTVLFMCKSDGGKDPSEKWPIESEPYEPNVYDRKDGDKPRDFDSNFLIGKSLFDDRRSMRESDPIRQAEVFQNCITILYQ
jgi:hypothetical protein